MRFVSVLLLSFIGVLFSGCSGEPDCLCEYPDGSCSNIVWLDLQQPDDSYVFEEAQAADRTERVPDLPDTRELLDEVIPDTGPQCPLGATCNPIPIFPLPFFDARDGTEAPSDSWDSYSPCAPDIDESGGEWVYYVVLDKPGVLHLKLNDIEGDDVDMDVHLLEELDPGSCLARAHVELGHYVTPGTYFVVVDTWVDEDLVEYSGPYELSVSFNEGSLLPEEAGFNKYVVESINDWTVYPKDGTYPFCYQNPSCEPDWVEIYFGMIHDTFYLGEFLFEGTQRCYCCGHSLEVFLDAYHRYQQDNGLAVTKPYGDLTLDDVDVGPFYQHWFGWGVATTSSSANALEDANIGMNIDPADWELAVTGDFLNISRSNGTGHAVIFVEWVYEANNIIGVRYYGCNGSGDSHPDSAHPDNISGVSGPSFVTEYFEGHGGKVLPGYVFLGRAFDPAGM